MRILTIDVEDWFHILDNPATDSPAAWPRLESRVECNTHRILDALASHGVHATFFCLGWVAEHRPALVRRIVAEGHEVGTHSYAHLPVSDARRGEFEADLVRSLRLLGDVAGRAITCYRAPGTTLSLRHAWAIDALVAHGITLDCSMRPCDARGEPALRGPATIECPAGRLRELPVGGERVLGVDIACCSSGHFRLCPYPIVRWQLRRRGYVMSYFHPRDFDPDQPAVEGLSCYRRWKGRVGLGSSFERFHRMLDDFEFMGAGEAARRIDWAAAPMVQVGRSAAAPAAAPLGPGTTAAPW